MRGNLFYYRSQQAARLFKLGRFVFIDQLTDVLKSCADRRLVRISILLSSPTKIQRIVLMKTNKSNHNNVKDAYLGAETMNNWSKNGLLPYLAPQTTHVLTKHIEQTKGEDIPEIEIMLKGMREGNDDSYGSFDDFTRTLFASEHYQQNLDELTRAAYPTTTNK